MRGGAQGHLMRCSDGQFYVVKFRNNPQHLRVLTNEMLGTRLAERAGLPVPQTEVVEVGDWLVEHTAELSVQLAHNTIPCQAGLQFGSRYAVSPMEGQVFDYLPSEMFGLVRNLETFAGILVLDKWTGNANGRQAAFWRKLRERKYTVAFIDQGYCFNAGEWTFPDYPLRGVYARNEVYEGVRGWESFEPWLSRIEKMGEDVVWGLAGEIPPEWYGGEWDELEKLVRTLIVRRGLVRELIEAFRVSPRRPFPEWREQA
jgi:HipA-like protein